MMLRYQNRHGARFSITGDPHKGTIHILPEEEPQFIRVGGNEIVEFVDYEGGPFLQLGDGLETLHPSLYKYIITNIKLEPGQVSLVIESTKA